LDPADSEGADGRFVRAFSQATVRLLLDHFSKTKDVRPGRYYQSAVEDNQPKLHRDIKSDFE
jgi:hypothetical protein